MVVRSLDLFKQPGVFTMQHLIEYVLPVFFYTKIPSILPNDETRTF